MEVNSDLNHLPKSNAYLDKLRRLNHDHVFGYIGQKVFQEFKPYKAQTSSPSPRASPVRSAFEVRRSIAASFQPKTSIWRSFIPKEMDVEQFPMPNTKIDSSQVQISSDDDKLEMPQTDPFETTNPSADPAPISGFMTG